MGFSTLVRICNLRYFFALGKIAKVAKVAISTRIGRNLSIFRLQSSAIVWAA
jgi:hypothetical protein